MRQESSHGWSLKDLVKGKLILWVWARVLQELQDKSLGLCSWIAVSCNWHTIDGTRQIWYCKSSYSLSKKHRWIKWLAQASTCGKWPEHIKCGFSSKTLLSYFCEWLYNEGSKMGNSGCSISGLFNDSFVSVTASLTIASHSRPADAFIYIS